MDYMTHFCKRFVLFSLLFCVFSLSLFAQEDESPPDDEGGSDENWELPEIGLYSAGDMVLSIGIGASFPIVLEGYDGSHLGIPPEGMLHVGFTGGLGFDYFITPEFYAGGELLGAFYGTRAENTLYVLEIIPRAGYQFVISPFEIPLELGLGFYVQTLSNIYYICPILKAGAGFYWRFNTDWSFGLNLNYKWMPQWTRDVKKNFDMHVLDLMIGMKVHM
ncbi:MAG: hypothetical protein LBM77_01875 [Spirochaetaceae bacterium]|jgi:hypothetical protein|nr:hypothetical protein [Spirochaetaceae bacterium]